MTIIESKCKRGVVTLLDVIDNLIPPSNGAPLPWSIACDSELTIEVMIPTHQQEWAMKVKHEYSIQLNQNRRIIFTAFNGLLSSHDLNSSKHVYIHAYTLVYGLSGLDSRTVEPLNNGYIGADHFVHDREVVLFQR